ncbi:hypothetical protein AB0E67_05665 [Streptomyces sp. NPDC032161]|uniref:hypothetical protein n=1 Tax=unclassified Streptomyces TaxID=2593676 RepID=UPI00340E4C89
MRRPHDREAVNRLARAVLAGQELNEKTDSGARAELEQFDMVAAAFHATPRPGRGARRDEALGFDFDGATVAVTTLVLAVAADTLTQVAQESTRRLGTRVSSWFRRVVLRRPDHSAEDSAGAAARRAPAPLTAEQMRRIHRSADRHARRMRVPAEVAAAIADGIVAELAMGADTPPASAGAPDGGESEPDEQRR